MEEIRNIIQQNQHTLKSILSEAKRTALQEIDHREATKSLCDIKDAQDELNGSNDLEILSDGTVLSYYDKRRKTSGQIYQDLTQGVIESGGDGFHLFFSRKEPDDSTTEVNFTFSEVIYLSDVCAVIQGEYMRKGKLKTIQIGYDFNTQSFFEAVYCNNNNAVRKLRPLCLDIAGCRGKVNIETARNLIHFLCLCYYSKQDKIADISN